MYSSSIFVILLPAIVSALNYCEGDKSIAGYCTVTSYTDLTPSTPNAPSISECQDACRGVSMDAGDWIVDFTGKPEGYISTMVGYPCAFAVGRADGQPLDVKFSMHNQDIVDVIDEVSRRFGGEYGGRVAAEGTMVCEGFEARWYVN